MTENPNALFNMAGYCIGRAAQDQPERTALLVHDVPSATEPGEEWRYIDLERAVLQFAAALNALGLKRGDRVAIHLGDSSRSALLFFGAIAGGFVALPVSEHLTIPELGALLEDSGAALIATNSDLPTNIVPAGVRVLSADDVEDMFWDRETGRYCGSAADYAATQPDDPAFLIYTSGTTAQPKGVLHAHRSALGRRPMYQDWYGITPDDRMLHAGSFNWTYTLGVGLTDPWANGATAIVYTGEKKPELWPGLIRATGATLFAAVPAVYRQILKYANPTPDNLGALRHGLMAGETPPPGLIEEWTRVTGRPLYEALGMSEISTYISTGPDVPPRPGTTGKAQPGRRVAILPTNGGTESLPPGTEGLIAVHRSDPGLMLGYWNRPQEEAQVYRGDWFTGGDLGRMDRDGYITHLGRANDIMNAQGYRVAPQEVEAVLAQCPGVAEVACAETQVRSDVSVIGAFVVRTPGAGLDKDALLSFAAARLAPYKIPREIVFLDALPRTPNGKVIRSLLSTRSTLG
jgi:acetyl-CoA synthetase